MGQSHSVMSCVGHYSLGHHCWESAPVAIALDPVLLQSFSIGRKQAVI